MRMLRRQYFVRRAGPKIEEVRFQPGGPTCSTTIFPMITPTKISCTPPFLKILTLVRPYPLITSIAHRSHFELFLHDFELTSC